MSRDQVPHAAITAGLWFMLGRSLDSPQPQASAQRTLGEDTISAVTQMLTDQGAAGLVPEVLDTVQAGREHAEQDASATLSAKRYDQLRADFLAAHTIQAGKGRTLWPVGSTTALKRTGGSWNAALSSAGLAVSAKPTAAGFGRARFTQEQFDAAIGEFAAHCVEVGTPATYQRYVAWHREQKSAGRNDLPSGAAIRNTYGSWSAALETASSDQ